jgi:hypothetical protein
MPPGTIDLIVILDSEYIHEALVPAMPNCLLISICNSIDLAIHNTLHSRILLWRVVERRYQPRGTIDLIVGVDNEALTLHRYLPRGTTRLIVRVNSKHLDLVNIQVRVTARYCSLVSVCNFMNLAQNHTKWYCRPDCWRQ